MELLKPVAPLLSFDQPLSKSCATGESSDVSIAGFPRCHRCRRDFIKLNMYHLHKPRLKRQLVTRNASQRYPWCGNSDGDKKYIIRFVCKQ